MLSSSRAAIPITAMLCTGSVLQLGTRACMKIEACSAGLLNIRINALQTRPFAINARNNLTCCCSYQLDSRIIITSASSGEHRHDPDNSALALKRNRQHGPDTQFAADRSVHTSSDEQVQRCNSNAIQIVVLFLAEGTAAGRPVDMETSSLRGHNVGSSYGGQRKNRSL